MNIDFNRCIGEFSLKAVLATVVSVNAILHTSSPSVVLKTMMNVNKDRDLAFDMSRSIGFGCTDLICSGNHGNAGASNLASIDLVCVCYVWHMQKYAQSMVCANRCRMASSKHHSKTTVEVFQKYYGYNRAQDVNEV